MVLIIVRLLSRTWPIGVSSLICSVVRTFDFSRPFPFARPPPPPPGFLCVFAKKRQAVGRPPEKRHRSWLVAGALAWLFQMRHREMLSAFFLPRVDISLFTVTLLDGFWVFSLGLSFDIGSPFCLGIGYLAASV